MCRSNARNNCRCHFIDPQGITQSSTKKDVSCWPKIGMNGFYTSTNNSCGLRPWSRKIRAGQRSRLSDIVLFVHASQCWFMDRVDALCGGCSDWIRQSLWWRAARLNAPDASSSCQNIYEKVGRLWNSRTNICDGLPESSPRLSICLITVLNALDPASSLFETMCSLVIDYSDLFGDSFQSTGRYLALRS